jgi:hypothetical protein
MSTNVQKFGKFRYIEPNDVFENKLYAKNSGEGSYNITQPIEDYSIGVELEVSIPNRGTWVTSNTANDSSEISEIRNNSVVSFFDGNDGHLTNTPGTLIYKDLINGKQDKESLGITNIHIGYTSYYHPEVTIQFTDIRGMGLMMPHEESYRQESVNSTVRVEKFFAALFTFPYPEFKLRVKGFYGKKVEYSLVVSDFKSSFNNETGNFDATVKFIGKMYGVYTDIPISYLLIAPYCRYGKNDNEETIWEQKNFTFDDGRPMPTFLELREMLYRSNELFEEISSGKLGNDLAEVIIKKRKVDAVNNAYNAFKSHMIESFANDTNPMRIFHHEGIFLFPHDETDNGKRYSYIYGYKNSKVKTLTQNIYNAIYDFNACYPSDGKIPFLLPFTNANGEIGVGAHKVTFTKVGGVISDNVTWEDEELEFDVTPKIKSYVSQRIKGNDGSMSFFIINAKSLIEKVKSLLDEYGNKINIETNNFNSAADSEIEHLLTFRPSIKNIYSMIMAHLQVFVELFKACVDEINSNSNRTIASLGINKDSLVDIPSYMKQDSTHIPPFPAVKNPNTNTICYPTDLSVESHHFPELELINKLYSAYSSVADDLNDFNQLSDTFTNEGKYYYIPTCISDFSSFDLGKRNPYSYVFNDNNGNIKVDWILTFFGYRCIQKFLTEDRNGSDSGGVSADDFGAFEAYNFWLANPELTKDIVQTLTAGDASNYQNFIKFLLGDYTYYTDKTEPCYSTHTHGENKKPVPLIQNCDDNGYKVRVFDNLSFAGRIGHGGSYFTQVKNDNASENHGKNFAGGKCGEKGEQITYKSNVVEYISRIMYGNKPFAYMKEIPKFCLEQWNEALCQYDGLPGRRETHVDLVSKYYTEPALDLYYFDDSNEGLGESNATNQARNVLYFDTSKTQKFYNGLSDGKSICDVYNFHSPNVVNDKNFEQSQVFLHSFHLLDQSPAFLRNLSAEDFLLGIPHNLYRIAQQLSNGRTIITIPYVTKLYIGYLIDKLQSFTENDEDKLTEWLDDVAKKVGTYETWGSRQIWNRPNYVLEGERLGSYEKYKKLIYLIVSYLTVNKNNGCHNSEKLWSKLEDIERSDEDGEFKLQMDATIMMMFAIKEKCFSKDISGFVKEYRQWRDVDYRMRPGADKISSFKWIKKNLTLNEYNENGHYQIPMEGIGNNIHTDKNSTYERLCDLLSRDQVNNAMKELNKYDNSIEAAKSTENILNRYFKRDGTIGYESKTPFGDVYCGIYFNKKENFLYLRFNPENEAVKELDRMFRTNCYFIMPYYMGYEKNTTNFENSTTSWGKFETAFNSFIKSIKELYEGSKYTEDGLTKINDDNVDYSVSSDEKLSTYLTLKNLYDKHLYNVVEDCSEKYNYKDRDKLGDKTEINRFHFIDSYYKDISDEFIFNNKIILGILDDVVKGYNSGKGEGIYSSEMSVYSFMSLLCQRHEMLLLSVPVFNGACNESSGIDNLEKMFTPLPYNNVENLKGPSYICFYPHKPSQHLDNPTSQYENDGFLITNDLNATSTFEGPTTIKALRDGEDQKYIIPSFGVEYGSQKQSVFKNITVNMDAPQVTEVSAVNLFQLSQLGNTDSTKIQFSGQDLYKIYSNYSYTCQVEMMGCAQVQPLMYFQLNNIPMFRGAYLIINVDHDIVPGDMKTTFKGVRINKTQIPMVSGFMEVDIEEFTKIMDNKYVPAEPYPLINADSTGDVTIPTQDDANNPISLERINNEVGEYIEFSSPSASNGFNRLNPSLRKLVYSIAKDLPSLSEQLGYKIGMCITSTIRYNPNSSSDHGYINYNETTSKNLVTARSKVEGTALDENGDVIGNKNYYYMGCAIDFHGTKNGEVDRGDASVQLYNHIAMNYYKEIRQLIWEVKYGTRTNSNTISNVIHLASYGPTDKANLFVASVKDGETTTVKGKKRLPSAFIDICNKLKKKDRDAISSYSYNV